MHARGYARIFRYSEGIPFSPELIPPQTFINKIKTSSLLPHSVLSPPLTTCSSYMYARICQESAVLPAFVTPCEMFLPFALVLLTCQVAAEQQMRVLKGTVSFYMEVTNSWPAQLRCIEGWCLYSFY